MGVRRTASGLHVAERELVRPVGYRRDGSPIPPISGGAGVPTLVSYNQKTDWTSVGNPSTTAAFAVQNGDLILVMLGEENAFQCTVTSVATSPSFGTLTQLELRENTSNTSLAGAYYIVATSSQASVTASFTTSQNNEKGICAWVFRDHNGIGAHAIGIDQTQPSVVLTTTQANSTICCFGSDWAAIDGARTYRQINGANPTERHYEFGSGSWTGYAYEYADAGGIGSVTAGMTAPTSQQAQTPVVEVLGIVDTWEPQTDAPEKLRVVRSGSRW